MSIKPDKDNNKKKTPDKHPLMIISAKIFNKIFAD